MASGEKIFTSSNYIYRLVMKVRLPEYCVKKTPESSCPPFFLTEYIQIDIIQCRGQKAFCPQLMLRIASLFHNSRLSAPLRSVLNERSTPSNANKFVRTYFSGKHERHFDLCIIIIIKKKKTIVKDTIEILSPCC